MATIGIDLGTTNSLVSVFTQKGSILIPNDLGHFITPSVIGISDNNEIIIGQAAKDRLVTHPDKSVARFKRYMGSYRTFKLGKDTYRADDLSSILIKKLKTDAEKFLNEPIESAVISVPAYFNDIQRKATYSAGNMAGLKIERLINEPTAAALAYGLNSKEDENTFLVVDLGGGTFDVSILEIFDGVMEVHASAGDAFLGGEDFTDEVLKFFLGQLELQSEDLSKQQLGNLRGLADRCKVLLSTQDNVTVKFNGPDGIKELNLSREEFETLTKSLQNKMRSPMQRAVRDAGLRAENIDRVVLVGGATRMPIIRALVTRLLKLFPEHSIDPDEVVARGAGVQAGLVDRHEALEDVVMTDVSPFTMGTEVSVNVGVDKYESGHFQPIIERNTVIPVSRVVRNATKFTYQRTVTLNIYQGESPRVADNINIGTMKVKLPPREKDTHEEFDIRFTYDVSGILEILVTTLSDGVTKRMVIEGNPGSLSKAEIDTRFKALNSLKTHPRDKAENLALIARLKRAYENHLGETRQDIEHKLTALERILASQNETDIKLMQEKLHVWLQEIDSFDVF